jgi:hypothetical protein
MEQAHAENRADTLDYLHSMLMELRVMAEAECCDTLAYLIEMACVEVSDIMLGEQSAPVRQGERQNVA